MIILQPIFKDKIIIIPATNGDEIPSQKGGFVHSCTTFAELQRNGKKTPTPPMPARLFTVGSNCKIPDLFRFYADRLDEVSFTPAQIPKFVEEHSAFLVGEGRPNLFFARQCVPGSPEHLVVDVRVICLGNAIKVKLYSNRPDEGKKIESVTKPRLIIADRAA